MVQPPAVSMVKSSLSSFAAVPEARSSGRDCGEGVREILITAELSAEAIPHTSHGHGQTPEISPNSHYVLSISKSDFYSLGEQPYGYISLDVFLIHGKLKHMYCTRHFLIDAAIKEQTNAL